MAKKSKAVAIQEPYRPKPTLRIHGSQAKALHGVKPGSAAHFIVKGRMMNCGYTDYDNVPEANVQVHSVRRIAKARAKSRAGQTDAGVAFATD